MRPRNGACGPGLLQFGNITTHTGREHPGQAGIVVAGQAGQDGQPVEETQVATDYEDHLVASYNNNNSNDNNKHHYHHYFN